jgi:hypothetical protein
MTRIEALIAVLNDPHRSDAERQIARRALENIRKTGSSAEREAAALSAPSGVYPAEADQLIEGLLRPRKHPLEDHEISQLPPIVWAFYLDLVRSMCGWSSAVDDFAAIIDRAQIVLTTTKSSLVRERATQLLESLSVRPEPEIRTRAAQVLSGFRTEGAA